MKLPKRLASIASVIDENTNVIDVGCDHALLDIYLTINNKNKCIATDINENALSVAKNNIKKYKLENKINTEISNGLKNIDIPNNNTIVISGMGASTIIDIVSNSNINEIDNLIIQSNNYLYKLRKEIVKLGFYIVDEVVVEDKKKYYVVIKFKKGKKKYKYFDYYYGPVLKKKKNREYIENLIFKNNKIIKSLPYNKVLFKLKLIRNNKLLKKLV